AVLRRASIPGNDHRPRRTGWPKRSARGRRPALRARGGRLTSDERSRARDVMDAQDGTGPVTLLDSQAAGELLARARRIAIVGASPNPMRPSNSVMSYLRDEGYEVVPINPNSAEILGTPAYASLEEAVAATGSFDIVDVFRRP